MTDNMALLVKDAADMPPSGAAMPILRLYFESIKSYVDAKVLIAKRMVQSEVHAKELSEPLVLNSAEENRQMSKLSGNGQFGCHLLTILSIQCSVFH